MRKTLKIGIVILILAILIAIDLFLVRMFKTQKTREYNEALNLENQFEQNISSDINENNAVLKTQNLNEEKKLKENFVMPEGTNLEVPFTCQAPYQNWNMPWQEACEEAGLIMIDHYLKGEYLNSEIPKDVANQEILDMVDWQVKNWGGHYDITAKEIADLAKQYYNYQNIEVKYDITIDDIKRELAQGNPVLVPAAGQLLDNPHFTAPGPIYHVVDIVGFDENGFITNDPGIWQGFKFRYAFDNLYNAIHDFDPNSMLNGKKAMVVIKK